MGQRIKPKRGRPSKGRRLTRAQVAQLGEEFAAIVEDAYYPARMMAQTARNLLCGELREDVVKLLEVVADVDKHLAVAYLNTMQVLGHAREA